MGIAPYLDPVPFLNLELNWYIFEPGPAKEMQLDKESVRQEPGAQDRLKGERVTKRALLVVICLLAVALVTVCVLFAVFSAKWSNDACQDALRLLWLVREDPANVLYQLRSVDHPGRLLQDALETVWRKDPHEFDELAIGDIPNAMFGDDGVAFITGANSQGGSNAETLGYYNACLDLIGIDELPWPQNKEGKPYNGVAETTYDTEFVSVIDENEKP